MQPGASVPTLFHVAMDCLQGRPCFQGTLAASSLALFLFVLSNLIEHHHDIVTQKVSTEQHIPVHCIVRLTKENVSVRLQSLLSVLAKLG